MAGRAITAAEPAADAASLPPRVLQSRRFLAQRGWPNTNLGPLSRGTLPITLALRAKLSAFAASAGSAAVPQWQSLGPVAVQTPAFGLVTGRIAALALDPSDQTGNRLYVGTTGGGVWVAQNAATSNPASVQFTPLTDSTGALNGAFDASISIGALTVQPGGTGVILAGSGDPNDVLDSYYGGGILRSTDGGKTWTVISRTSDVAQGLGAQDFRFYGEGFSGFAWSTVNPQTVVAAVSQAYEGTLVNALQPNSSYEGLYYSADSGGTWHLATITDGSGNYVQGPLAAFAAPDGNAATSVVWNPVRKIFIAAVRFHGYYQSSDGVTWTRIAAQPGSGLTAQKCPANPGLTGSIACPIYRGSLAVNPATGDTFAWTVDLNDQDQGLWQDQCALSGGVCGNQPVTFGKQWNTAALQIDSNAGAATIPDGSYTLALAAIPSAQDTILLAGADDLWKCNLAMGCAWRNTTNVTTCKSAQVGQYQHALAWNPANPLELFAGNDSGLWRSMDAVGESGSVCSSSDASHFQNLNGTLGSLAEVVSLSQQNTASYAIMAGLGVNGTAGIKSGANPADWPQILSGYGGVVAIDPADSSNWYVNSQAGVSIYRCSQSAPCTPADFGSSPVVYNVDVGGDGLTMPNPAPFLVDPLDSTQLLIGTCRVWRGPASGIGWSASNAISPIFSNGLATGPCNGNALIRSMAAMPLSGGTEKIYLGTYGSLNGGASLPGHVLSATVNPSSTTAPKWIDLTLAPVSNDSNTLNQFGLDISSIYIDPHDATGKTAYVTVEGAANLAERVQTIYRTTDGGAHWSDLTANLPNAPVSGVVVDPQDSGAVYLATDVGVYFTTQVANCAVSPSACWSQFGTGLPAAPVVALSTSPAGAASPSLYAATYGRGIWQAPLATAAISQTTISLNPAALTFAAQASGTSSSPQTITVQNTGGAALNVTTIAITGDFSETDNCVNATIAAGSACAIQVKFTPSAAGTRTGAVTISANISGAQIAVPLSGTGTAASVISLTPPSLDFAQVAVGTESSPLSIQANNSGGVAVAISSISVSVPFTITTNSCGTVSLAANTSCQVQLKFAPVQAGPVTGTLTLVDAVGTQTVALTGTGAAVATDSLAPASLSFQATPSGALSSAQTVTLTNAGDLALASISISASGPFQISNTCGTQLAGHASCDISVTFAPTQQGNLSGTLSVSDALRTQTVSLSGIAVAPPSLSVVPAGLNFSGQQPGAASAPQTLTISNTGGAPLSNIGIQITGTAAASYSVGSTTCGAILNSGSSCTVQVIFTPGATGIIGATLIVTSPTSGVAPIPVPLNGTGQLTTGVGGTPAQVAFPAVGVGQSSTTQAITISNSSGFAVASLTLAVSAPFVLTQNNCTSGLAAGANCTASISFQPTTSGMATGVLTVTSPAMAAPTTVALSGIGFDFTAALSGLASVTVAAGQTASYTVIITPAGGASGTFAYACGTLPANAVCQFNPATTTVSTGATGNVTVQIATGKAGAARLERSFPWQSLPLACGFFLLPLALRRRRKALLLVSLLGVLTLSVSSCTSSGIGKSGSTGGSGGSSATPPGTYSIPVTFTSTGVSHAVNVTLTVD